MEGRDISGELVIEMCDFVGRQQIWTGNCAKPSPEWVTNLRFRRESEMSLLSFPFECLGFFYKILQLLIVFCLLDSILAINENVIYRFDMLHIKCVPLSIQIGTLRRKGARGCVNVLYTDRVQLNVKFKTHKYHRRFNAEKEKFDIQSKNNCTK